MRAWGWLLLLSWCGPAFAGQWSAEVEAWRYQVSGIYQNNQGTFNLQSDLGVSSRTQVEGSVAYRPDNRWIPQIGFDYGHLQGAGQITASGTTTSGLPLPIPGLSGVGSTTINASGRVDDYQLTARWSLLRFGPLDAAGGLAVKRLNGDVVTQDQSNGSQSRETVNKTFPMLSGEVQITPLKWLAVDVRGGWISYQGDSANQWRVGLRVHVFGPLAMQVAWQEKHYHVHGNNYQLKAGFKGPTYGLVLTLP